MGVLLGAVLIGVYVGSYDASLWSTMAERVRRFVRRESD